LSAIYCTPGPDNSSRIKTENAVPSNPENNAKIRYNVPISFALHDKNQRSHQREILACLGISSNEGVITLCLMARLFSTPSNERVMGEGLSLVANERLL